MAKLNLGRSSAVYFVARLVPALLGFLTIPVFTKSLGVQGYGTFSLIMGGIGLLVVLSTGWLESTFVRFVGGRDANSRDYAKNYTLLLISTLGIMVIIVSIGSQLFSEQLGDEVHSYIFSAILTFIVIALFRPLMNYYRIFELSHRYAAGMISFSVFRFLIASALLFFISHSPDMIFYAYFIVGFVIVLFPLTAVIRLSKNAVVKFSYLKDMIKYGLPYLPMMAANWVFSMFNRFAIDQILGRESVGTYSAAYNMTDQSIGFLYVAIMMAIFPRMVKLFDNGDLQATKNILEHGLSLYAIIIIPSIVGFAFVGKELLPLLSSEEFSAAAKIIPFLAVNTGIIGLNQYFSKPFELKKKTLNLMLIFVAGASINMLLVFPLVKMFGLYGAVASNSLSLATIGLLLFFKSRSLLSFKVPLKITLKVTVAVIVMSFVLWGSSFVLPLSVGGVIVKVLIGLLSYSVVGIRMGFHKYIVRHV